MVKGIKDNNEMVLGGKTKVRVEREEQGKRRRGIKEENTKKKSERMVLVKEHRLGNGTTGEREEN